jgi:hypothetical protein
MYYMLQGIGIDSVLLGIAVSTSPVCCVYDKPDQTCGYVAYNVGGVWLTRE